MCNGVRTNESAPDSIESGTPVDQPSPESCSLPPYALIPSGEMALTGYCGNAAGSYDDISGRNRRALGDHERGSGGKLASCVSARCTKKAEPLGPSLITHFSELRNLSGLEGPNGDGSPLTPWPHV